MKKNIPFLFLFIISMLLVSSCGKDDDIGNGGNGGGTSITKITISPVSKFEGDINSTFDFKVRLSQASSADVTVDFTTNDKSAVQEEDYIAQNGTLTFSGTMEQIISVEIVADTLSEGDEEFEIEKLPGQAQLAPIKDFLIQDFDKDNHLDILLAGNWYVSEVETPRADAGTGLLLTNNKNKFFKL